MEKYCTAGQPTRDYITHAHCMQYTYSYRHTHTLRICNTDSPLHERLHKRVPLLRSAHTACLFLGQCFYCVVSDVAEQATEHPACPTVSNFTRYRFYVNPLTISRWLSIVILLQRDGKQKSYFIPKQVVLWDIFMTDNYVQQQRRRQKSHIELPYPNLLKFKSL